MDNINYERYLKIKRDQEDIYKEDKSVKLNEQIEIINKLLFSFNNHVFDENDNFMVHQFKERILDIVKIEVVDLDTDIEMEFSNRNSMYLQSTKCDRLKTADGTYKDIKPQIIFYTNRLFKELKDANSKIRHRACKNIFYGILHEGEHLRQYYRFQTGVCSSENLRLARDFIIADSGIVDKKVYDDNYDNFYMEKDAEEKAFLQYNKFENDKYSQYSIDSQAIEKIYSTYSYTSNEGIEHVKERDDMAIEIIDDLIINKKETSLLLRFPILQREYNLDGTKKDSHQLIEDMNIEVDNIAKNENLSESDIEELSKDTKEMYYELIYRAAQKEDFKYTIPHEIAENMKKYFIEEKETKISQIDDLYTKEHEFVLPMVKKSFDPKDERVEVVTAKGRISISYDDFFKTLDKTKMSSKILLRGKTKTAEEFIRTNFSTSVPNYALNQIEFFIPKSGEYVLKDETIVSAKEFIEEYVIPKRDFSKNVPPIAIKDYLKSTIMSKPDADKELKKRDIKEYYSEKINNIDKIIENSKTKNSKTEKKVEATQNNQSKISIQNVNTTIKTAGVTKKEVNKSYEEINERRILKGLQYKVQETRGKLSAFEYHLLRKYTEKYNDDNENNRTNR